MTGTSSAPYTTDRVEFEQARKKRRRELKRFETSGDLSAVCVLITELIHTEPIKFILCIPMCS